MIRDDLDVLIDRIGDVGLRIELKSKVDQLRNRRVFGLVFERHLPERVRLPEHTIRRGVKVTLADEARAPTWEVLKLKGGKAEVRRVGNSDGTSVDTDDPASVTEFRPLDELVVIADFGEPIYPGLRRLGSVARGGDKPAHVVIKGENHHVLEALQFSHAGKIDCIYIDPPYNTGARDWKYDNDYVDESDGYRHSKWLAFMERRLLLAKTLLNSDDSALIVTIDEKELPRLTLLLDQIFVGCKRQMITTVISPGGTSRTTEFSRVEEYILTVFIGGAEIRRASDSMLGEVSAAPTSPSALWEGMVRRGNGVVRSQRPGQFYPIYVDPNSKRIVEAGAPLPLSANRSGVRDRDGLVTVWPIKPGGTEGFWQLGPESLMKASQDGTAKAVYTKSTGHWTIKYMKDANAQAVREGRILTVGYEPNGDRILKIPDEFSKPVTPKTVWFRSAHDPSVHGARLLTQLVPGHAFPFPKSLYAVEDTIRFFVRDKRKAVVLDFFAGSGTTAHAVARLNQQDGGHRQSISVTNNEVSADEASALRADGYHPGDPEWESQGIFEHVARPRIEAAVTGQTPRGGPVKGDYRFNDVFPIADGLEENVVFLELTYQDPDAIELDAAFDAVAALMWLRAGAEGPVIDERVDNSGRPKPFEWTDRYGVLFNTDRWRGFVREMPDRATTAFIVTDSDATFHAVVAELPGSMKTLRLYENYLSTFRLGL